MGVKISEIIRTKRKTLALEITADAKLIVRAPLSTPQEYISRMVERKSGWVRRKQQEIVRRNETYVQKQFENGEDYMFLGNRYRLEYSRAVSSVTLEGGRLLLPTAQKSEAAKLIKAWYRHEAQKVFEERVRHYAAITGLKYKSVRVSAALTRWGSCGINGTLNFSWRLAMAPLCVIDAIVVHELVHIEFRNHSKKYWSRVRMIMPDYDQQKKWIKENQRKLEM